MLQDIYYSRRSNKAVQVISQCRILPEGTEAVCFQELSGNYEVFVLGKEHFTRIFHKRGRRSEWEADPGRAVLSQRQELPGQRREALKGGEEAAPRKSESESQEADSKMEESRESTRQEEVVQQSTSQETELRERAAQGGESERRPQEEAPRPEEPREGTHQDSRVKSQEGAAQKGEPKDQEGVPQSSESEPVPQDESLQVSWERDDGKISGIIRFLDADTYAEKMRILSDMKDNLDEHILNNMAVSLDLSIDDGVDGYSFLMSELRIRSRYEGKRGDRL